MSGSRPPCLQAAEADLLRISNKVRFILAVVDGRLKLSKRRKADIEAELEAEGYDKLPSQKKAQQLVRVAGKGKAAARRTAADMAGGMGTMGCIVHRASCMWYACQGVGRTLQLHCCLPLSATGGCQ